jgi:hypothetical protein
MRTWWNVAATGKFPLPREDTGKTRFWAPQKVVPMPVSHWNHEPVPGKFPKRPNRESNRSIREPNPPNREAPENSKFERDGVWEAIWAELHMALRKRMGREASPWAEVLDSQSVKSAEKGAVLTTKWVTTPASR